MVRALIEPCTKYHLSNGVGEAGVLQGLVEMLPEPQRPKAVWEHRADQASVEFPAERQELQVGGQLGVIQGLVDVIAQHQAFKAVRQLGVSEVLVERIAGIEHLQLGGMVGCNCPRGPDIQGVAAISYGATSNRIRW